jgi:hypothetical protein
LQIQELSNMHYFRIGFVNMGVRNTSAGSNHHSISMPQNSFAGSLGDYVFHAEYLSEWEKLLLLDACGMKRKNFHVLDSKHLMLSALDFTHNVSNENKKDNAQTFDDPKCTSTKLMIQEFSGSETTESSYQKSLRKAMNDGRNKSWTTCARGRTGKAIQQILTTPGQREKSSKHVANASRQLRWRGEHD